MKRTTRSGVKRPRERKTETARDGPSYFGFETASDSSTMIVTSSLEEGGDSDREEIDELYSDALISKAINIPINDCLAEGVTCKSVSNGVLSRLMSVIRGAGINARKYGEAMVMPVLVDKRGDLVPIDIALEDAGLFQVKGVVEITTFVREDRANENVDSLYFGMHDYRLMSGGKMHRSRFTMIRNNGGSSMVVSLAPYWKTFSSRVDNTTESIKRSNWLVLKTSLQALKQKAEENISKRGDIDGNLGQEMSKLIISRLRSLMNSAKNSLAFGIDKDSEDVIELQKSNISQMSQATTESMIYLASATGIPYEVFTGKSGTSLSSSESGCSVYGMMLSGVRSSLFDEFVSIYLGMVTGDDNVEWVWANKLIKSQE